MAEARIHCCVGSCPRSIGVRAALKRFGRVPSEYICQHHWRRLSRDERRVWARHQRRRRRFGCDVAPGASARIWKRLKHRCAA
ncbi:hypothetical protein [Novosphingobium sp. EMRT-2]|uniref:hypothetical protein n=1 Tax=Novosphingobium sp. EMRT-2 TaxID=2571749 RepID=UPI0010BD75D8|nr:hypothetical protein [Novosphingobium sp. EMRT-2]QCI92283.1 hypothetical protein FA702_01010 [Novosphingobium sp. EMRT-2]